MSEMAKEITRITVRSIHDIGCDVEDLMEQSKLRAAHLDGSNTAAFELLRELNDITGGNEDVARHMEKRVRTSHDQLVYQRGYTSGMKSIVDMLNKKREALMAAIDNPNIGERPENRAEELAERKKSSDDTEPEE